VVGASTPTTAVYCRLVTRRQVCRSEGGTQKTRARISILVLHIPLRTSRQRIGVLRLASLRSNNFSEDQVRFLYSVADQLALSMSERLSRERLRLT
jgi:hypothetical protein